MARNMAGNRFPSPGEFDNNNGNLAKPQVGGWRQHAAPGRGKISPHPLQEKNMAPLMRLFPLYRARQNPGAAKTWRKKDI